MPTPIPGNAYGSPEEESQRLFRKLRGTLPGTRIGIPGRSDSPQNKDGKWKPNK